MTSVLTFQHLLLSHEILAFIKINNSRRIVLSWFFFYGQEILFSSKDFISDFVL